MLVLKIFLAVTSRTPPVMKFLGFCDNIRCNPAWLRATQPLEFRFLFCILQINLTVFCMCCFFLSAFRVWGGF